MPSFFATVTDAINDIAEYGYESAERLEYWIGEIRRAAEQDMVSETALTRKLKRVLGATFERLIEDGSILHHHNGVDRFTLQRIAPHLRSELDRRLLASANLIRLNREQAINDTLRRFQGWATSIPAGGVYQIDRRELKRHIRKSLTSLPFEERRVVVDQGHKLNAALSEIVAQDADAIGAVWRSHWRQSGYDYREDHKERDKVFYAIRDSWAVQRRFLRIGEQGAWEDHEKPGEFVFCRCYARYVYNLRDVPADMLTERGKAALAEARERMTA
ncbi:MAG TPA: hypothetical protein VGM38_02420 [Pseudolysinimonas sp.]|jgi:hypothetical protein